MKKLKTYLQALQAGKHEEKIILGAIEQLKSCNLQELSEYRILIAEVYCRLLQYCQTMYEADVPEHIVANLLEVFADIEQIGREATEEEKKDSNLITVWFLHELKVHKESGDVWNIDDEMLRKVVQVLLKELDSIYFIFEIKENGQYVFPIHEMIATVVKEPGFVDINNPLGIYHIHILQLAVRLFTDNTDKQKILQTLVEQCKLKFINYLHPSGCIIDTPELLNYQENGVMIFCDKETNKVLIRNKNKDYFSVLPMWKIKEMKVEEERDYRNNIIGFFVEYDLDEGDLLIDYSDVLKDESGREAFLRLVFDRKIYNILFEDSIIKCADGTFQPVNPFCYNDAVVVKGKFRDKNGKCYDKEHFLDALSRYRNSALRISSKCIMNRVSFGLAVLLLQKENTGMDAFRLNEFVDDEWYQNQLLKNWTKSCSDPIEALTFITTQWQRENDYCIRTSNNGKKSKEKNIEDHEIEALDFYPLKSEIDWMYSMLGCENPKNSYVLHGKVREDDEGNFILGADLVYDVCGKKFSQDTRQATLSVEVENMKDPEGLLDNIWGSGEEYYFLYDSRKQKGIVYDQSLLKMLSALERIQEKNQLTLEMASKINPMQYKDIVAMMYLQKDALCEGNENIFCDFDSQVYYRLIHNLLWAKGNKDNISSYLRIFEHHQRLGFQDIGKDEKFMRKDEHTLYIPKDSRESDSVLVSIYNKYLRTKSVRETNDLYDPWIELREDGYYHNGVYIENVVFLCDNFEVGNATIRMLKAYLNIDITGEKEEEKRRVESAKSRCQKYYLKRDIPSTGLDIMSQTAQHLTKVTIGDIIVKNSCNIEVHSYYGTETGKNAIESFFQKQCIKNAVVTYEHEILNHSSQIVNYTQCIWPGAPNNVYTVVREFNMTKRNVFPEAMLNNPKKAICMFVKKREII